MTDEDDEGQAEGKARKNNAGRVERNDVFLEIAALRPSHSVVQL